MLCIEGIFENVIRIAKPPLNIAYSPRVVGVDVVNRGGELWQALIILESFVKLRRALGDRLPEEVLRYRKWGFGVPWTRYLQREPEFRDLIATLPDTAPIADGPFDRQALRTITTGFLNGETRFESHVLRLVKIAIWYDACLKDQQSASTPFPEGAKDAADAAAVLS